jgi:hypothetical protein
MLAVREQSLAVKSLFDDGYDLPCSGQPGEHGLSDSDATNLHCHGRASSLVFIVPQLILEGDGPFHYTKSAMTISVDEQNVVVSARVAATRSKAVKKATAKKATHQRSAK